MEYEKYTDRAKGFLQSAQTMALRRGHQRLTPEHLLKVLLEDTEGLCANLIRAAGGDPKPALQAVDADLDRLPKVEGSGAGQVYMSPELARVFEQAEQLAQKAGDNFVTVERLLLALAAAAGTGAAKALAAARVDAQSLNRAIEEVRKGRKAGSATAEEGYDALKKSTQPVLKIYGTRGSSACYNIRDFLHRSAVPMDRSDQRRTGTRRGTGVGPRRSAVTYLRIPRRHPHKPRHGASS